MNGLRDATTKENELLEVNSFWFYIFNEEKMKL